MNRTKVVEPEELSAQQIAEFTQGFTVPMLKRMHRHSTGNGIQSLEWPRISRSQFLAIDESQLSKICHYPEAIPSLNTIDFSGFNHALILGSSFPWLELYLMKRKVQEITTVEYRELKWDVRQLPTRWSAMTFEEFRTRAGLGDFQGRFDLFISYSSIEHSGLGRYGDLIDPNGDIDTLRVIRPTLHKQAAVFLAIPLGLDCVLFNRHRVYGMLRLKQLCMALGRTKVAGCTPLLSDSQDRKDGNGDMRIDNLINSPVGNDGTQVLIKFID